ncbi:hypothetical protein [Deinococcus sp. YIM 77859]|uniref:hypothetical protein n=1 Tax=Deinococcus sp. YIM 77859 TaxID=1540221 RepID=UPI000A5E1342|nr:hypothetical protein [Deinococcus sp. YIM 77859]
MESVLTVKCKLKPDPVQAGASQATAELFAAGWNVALRLAREHSEFRRFKLHHLAYPVLREMGLSANLAVQAVAHVGSRAGGFNMALRYGSTGKGDATTPLILGKLVRRHDPQESQRPKPWNGYETPCGRAPHGSGEGPA